MKRWGIILLFLPFCLVAQQKKTVKPGWRSIATAGFSAGESGASPVFQLSGGIRYSRFFSGIGIGYDLYEFNSFPLFADWRMGLGKQQLVFVYAMPGYNIPGKFTKEVSDFRTVTERQMGGFYMDAGIGYRIPSGILSRLSFSAGYVRKSFAHKKIFANPCGTVPCTDLPAPEKYVYRYNYGLITTKLSWELGK
ncbi:MAG: hypothetical protein ABI675_12515 [Chitinophagaceae bacterium]